MPQNYSRDILRQGEDFASVLKDTLCKYVKGHLKTIRTLPPHVRAAPWDRPAPGTLWAHKVPRNASVSVALPAPMSSVSSQPATEAVTAKEPTACGTAGSSLNGHQPALPDCESKGQLGKGPSVPAP